jgi:hypothetical protein
METPLQTNALKNSECSLPTETEIVALGQSGPLIRYACENIPNLDPDLSLALAEAVEAQKLNQWTPRTSQRFWGAFNILCEKIKPVTMDCLTAHHKNIPTRRLFRFWEKPIKESLGEQNSRTYLNCLIFLLILIVPFQLLVWVYSNLSKDLDQKSNALSIASSELSVKCQTLDKHQLSANDGKTQYVWTPETTAEYDSVLVAENDLLEQSSKLSESTQLLNQWLFKRANATAITGDADQNDWFKKCINIIDTANASKQGETKAIEQANLYSSILLQFLLPILLGLIGALAYVLRNTSDQIKNTTFSTTSPIRNWVRVMLGALMGVVIGLFGELSSQISLPPLAMAFLAGYGVEAVFSVFDGFIDKLRPSNKSVK